MEQKTLICKQIFLLNMLKASRSFFLKRFIFNDDVKPKGEQSSIHEHLLNNPICAENYLDSRFEILSKARNTYHLSVLEPLFIRTREPKVCKQRDFYNLKVHK